MHHQHRLLKSLLTAVLLASPAVIAGCATHRYYDPDYRDYHRWDGNETTLYIRWEGETHRDHREFRKRNEREQREYWQWRHRDHDRDHGRDHDRDHDHD